jgi:NAD(P)-dependent dehydrogenase (short-subunit alcohol dehydrogenase family)
MVDRFLRRRAVADKAGAAGKAIWGLGCGPGIGMSVAERFAWEGFSLGLVTLDAGPIGKTVQGLRDTGVGAELAEGDMRDAAWLAGSLGRFGELFGPPGALVYNASAGVPGPASSLGADDLALDLGTNLLAPLRAVQHALPGMRRAKAGTVIFTGGGTALRPRADMASGSIGKCALRQLALLLGQELAAENIHVAVVTVSGFVEKGGALDPDAIAERYWALHAQRPPNWDREVEL